KRKRKDKESDNDEDYSAPANSRSAHSKLKSKKTGDALGPKGSIRFCARCQRRYLLVTASEFCPACLSLKNASTGMSQPTKKPRKKKTKIISDALEDGNEDVPSLKTLCINLIATYIDSVEDFGGISDRLKLSISKIIGRHRQLTPQNVKLFIGPGEMNVDLFECTYLDEAALCYVATLCPNARHLHLGYCGRATDKVLDAISEHCTQLTELSMSGPFLPSAAAFTNLFVNLPQLVSLHLKFAAKLNPDSLASLVDNCAGLQSLRLEGCTKLRAEGLRTIARLKNLAELELSQIEVSPDVDTDMEEALSHLITTIGPSLTMLYLNGFKNLPDRILSDLSNSCPKLSKLSLEENTSMTPEGVVSCLTTLAEKNSTPNGLTHLSLNRNETFTDTCLIAIVNLFPRLSFLGINGWDELSSTSLEALVSQENGLTELEEIDVSWVRNVTDDIFIGLMRNNRKLEKVKVYGCNRLTEEVVGKEWRSNGGEGKMVIVAGNEFV
ncbi:hypothetical protein BC832DRAFT_535640, partial [Gaertneriomyces semiglobifer]